MLRQVLAVSIALASSIISSDVRADIVVEWNFEGTTAPDTGIGSVALDGGTTAYFDSGPFGGGNQAWFTTNYATQFSGTGDRGLQFLFDTSGFTDLRIDLMHRSSGDSSNWYRVDYSLNNGVDWNLLDPQYQSGGYDTFVGRGIDLSTVSGASNNTGFGIRFRSIFSPVDFTRNGTMFSANTAYEPADSGDLTTAYSSSGHFAFDQFTVTGTAIAVPEPSSLVFLAVGSAAACFFRRARRALRARRSAPSV